MAKMTVSVSLEEDLIEMIDEVKIQKKLSSRSAALERILLAKQNDRDSIRKIVLEVLNEESTNLKIGNISVASKEKAMDEVEKSIKSSYESMPD